jgi:uncharacterized membrane protein (DUF485 family)
MVLDGKRQEPCFQGRFTPLFGEAQNPNPPKTMPEHTPDDSDFIHSEEFLHGLMRRQLKLSIACATAFIVLLFGLPLMNYFAPEVMAQRVGGFTLTWLILGVLFFPYVWIIAKWFIVRSIALEEAEVQHAAEGNKSKP